MFHFGLDSTPMGTPVATPVGSCYTFCEKEVIPMRGFSRAWCVALVLPFVAALVPKAGGRDFSDAQLFPDFPDIRFESPKMSARPTTINTYFDPAYPENFVRDHARPLDWRELFSGAERVIFIGDEHPQKELKLEFATQMHLAREAGITHLALEMLGDDQQGILDAYLKGTAPEEDVIRALVSAGFGNSDYYISIINAARTAGLRLVAIDHMINGPGDEDSGCGSNRMRESYRDCWMARNIARLVKGEPNMKVIVFVGRLHIQGNKENTIPEFLRAQGIPSLSYGFVTRFIQFHYCKPLFEDGMARQKLFIPLPKTLSGLDGLICIPDVFNETMR